MQHAQPASYKLEGVFARGYGVVPKSVLLLPELSPEAKALYAYYCILSGNNGGFQPSPGEEALLRAMNISHTRFLKHRKALVDRGLICFEQGRRSAGGKLLFEKGRFLIVKAPLAPTQGEPLPSGADFPLNDLAALQEGVFSEGFGLVPRLVMQDEALSIEAKAAYAFLCVFANASTRGERTATPSASLLNARLMTRKRAQNAMRELIERGYIRRERVHTGVYGGNCYILNFYQQEPQNDTTEPREPQSLFDTTEPPADKPCPVAVSSKETSSSYTSLPRQPQASLFDTAETRAPQARFETAENETPENRTALLFNTKRANTRPVNTQSIHPPLPLGGKMDRSNAPTGQSPPALSLEEAYRREASAQIEAEVLAQEYGVDILDAIVALMADIYGATGGEVRINGRTYPLPLVAGRFRTLRACHVEHVLERIHAEGSDQIANLQAYLTACLYNAPVSYGMANYHARGYL